MCGRHAKHWRLLGVAQHCVLPVELHVSVEVGVLEDVRVVVVTYDLVTYGIGRLVVDGIPTFLRQSLGTMGFSWPMLSDCPSI